MPQSGRFLTLFQRRSQNITQGNTLLQGLASYWNLDEASGDRLDITGTTTLLVGATVASNSGKINNCAIFSESVPGILYGASNPSIDMGDEDFTIAMWVNVTELPFDVESVWLSKWDFSSNKKSYKISLTETGRLKFAVSSDGITEASAVFSNMSEIASDITSNVWFLLIAWHDSVNNTINIQPNNGTIVTVSYANGVFSNDSAISMGGNVATLNTFASVKLDEVGIWNRVLTANERAALYNSGNGITLTI